MNVTVISAFRNAAGPQIARYFEQIDHLANVLAKRKPYTRLFLILGYGDSTDGTGEELFEAAADSIGALLIDCSHGGPMFGSIEDPQRFKQLAYVGNRLLDCVDESADVVGIVESDLLWQPDVIVRLIDDLEHLPPPFGAVAPMVMDGPESFYDVYAFRRGCVRFTKEPPFHADFDDPRDGYMLLDSAGSVLFMDGDLARKVRFTDEEAIVGLCAGIYARGGSIWLDTGASVCHP